MHGRPDVMERIVLYDGHAHPTYEVEDGETEKAIMMRRTRTFILFKPL